MRDTPQRRMVSASLDQNGVGLDRLGLLASALGVHETSTQAQAPTTSAPLVPLTNGDIPSIPSVATEPSATSNGVDLLQSFPFGDILGSLELDAVRCTPGQADVRLHCSYGLPTACNRSRLVAAIYPWAQWGSASASAAQTLV